MTRCQFMRDVVVMRMAEALSKNKPKADATTIAPTDSAALKEEVAQLKLQVTRLEEALKKEKRGKEKETDKEKKSFFGLL